MRRRLLIAAAFVGIAGVTYGQVLRSSFLADDYNLLLDVLRHPPFGDIASSGGERVIRPLSFMTVWLDHAAFGLHPWGYLVTGVLIHVANSLGVVVLTERLVDAVMAHWRPERERSAAAGVPLIAGLLFLVHPSHTEAVSWISARVDLVATGCFLVAVIAWLPAPGRHGIRGPRRHAVCVVAFVAALASKESVVVLPVVLSVLEGARAWVAAELGTPQRERLRRVAQAAAVPRVHYAVLVAYLATRWAIFGGLGSYDGEGQFGGSPLRLAANAVEGIGRSFAPAMPRPAWVVLGAATVGAFVAAALAARRSGRPVAVSTLVVVAATCVAVCSAPMATLGVSPIATGGERLVYLPSVFTCILIAWLIGAVRATGVAQRLVPALVVVVLAVWLTLVERVWVEAGRTADAVVRASATWPRDEAVVVVVLPDSVRGALVFRNGLDAMLVLEHGWTATASTVVILPRLSVMDDHIGVVRGDDGPGRWWINPCGRRDLLAPSGSRVPVVRRAGLRFEIELDPSLRRQPVWSFSDGAMRRVDAPEGGDLPC